MSTPAPLFWRLVSPDHLAGVLPAISELRGSVLWAGGRRPSFRRRDGGFFDTDSIDYHAWHVLGFAGERLAACGRLIPVSERCPGLVEQYIGTPRLAALSAEFGVPRHRIAEAGRWIVAPEHRSRGVSRSVIAGIWATARALGFDVVLGLAGTRDGQAQMLVRFGGSPVPDIALAAPDLDDELILLRFAIPGPPPSMVERIEAMERELGVDLVTSARRRMAT
jgi:predicted GNAT family N-acyltransferase